MGAWCPSVLFFLCCLHLHCKSPDLQRPHMTYTSCQF